jgi:hypothetical protein
MGAGMSTAAAIAKELKGHRSGRGYVVRCPAHDDRKASLSLRDGPDGLIVHCFTGCEPREVYDALRAQGLIDQCADSTLKRRGTNKPPASRSNHRDDDAARTARALKLWDEAGELGNTLAAKYLARRRITQLPPDVHESLRFHPKVIFGKDEADQWRFVPCLLALVRNVVTDKPQAVHRIGLTPAGDKLERLALGPIAGGAVKLWDDAEVTTGLVIGEGVETTLAGAMVAHKGTLLRPAWAVLNTSNMSAFPVLRDIECLTILVDLDPNHAGEIAAAECAVRWVAGGCEVHRLFPEEKRDAE